MHCPHLISETTYLGEPGFRACLPSPVILEDVQSTCDKVIYNFSLAKADFETITISGAGAAGGNCSRNSLSGGLGAQATATFDLSLFPEGMAVYTLPWVLG